MTDSFSHTSQEPSDFFFNSTALLVCVLVLTEDDPWAASFHKYILLFLFVLKQILYLFMEKKTHPLNVPFCGHKFLPCYTFGSFCHPLNAYRESSLQTEFHPPEWQNEQRKELAWVFTPLYLKNILKVPH